MKFDPIIEPLLHSPKLPVYLDELNAYYQEEKKKRQAFYQWITDEVKAEFIDGEVVIHSPAKNQHIECAGYLFQLLAAYVNMYNLGSVKTEKALVRLSRNDFEPDICFFGKEKSEAFHKQTMFFPPPDFVVEIISDSTESRDRGLKFTDYALHGVNEYWIIDAGNEMVEQYFLEGTEYVLHTKTNNGNISSRVINGFSIQTGSIFNKEKNVVALQLLMKK